MHRGRDLSSSGRKAEVEEELPLFEGDTVPKTPGAKGVKESAPARAAKGETDKTSQTFMVPSPLQVTRYVSSKLHLASYTTPA
jgi:hypothetical protein